MKICFMRHGESDYNKKKLLNEDPNVDVGLTEKGEKQVLKSAEKLKGERFDVIFSSELPRALESSEIINESFDVEVKTDGRINEIKLGLEGKPESVYNKARSESGENMFVFKLPGAESYMDVRKRVEGFLDWLKGQNYEEVLCVSHQSVVDMAYFVANDLENYPNDRGPFGNGEWFCFEL